MAQATFAQTATHISLESSTICEHQVPVGAACSPPTSLDRAAGSPPISLAYEDHRAAHGPFQTTKAPIATISINLLRQRPQRTQQAPDRATEHADSGGPGHYYGTPLSIPAVAANVAASFPRTNDGARWVAAMWLPRLRFLACNRPRQKRRTLKKKGKKNSYRVAHPPEDKTFRTTVPN